MPFPICVDCGVARDCSLVLEIPISTSAFCTETAWVFSSIQLSATKLAQVQPGDIEVMRNYYYDPVHNPL